MKKPIVLAVINFITIGFGTLILGKRPLFGLLLFVGGSLVRYEELRIAPAVTGSFSIHWLIATLGLAGLGLATAMDVHKEAQTP